MTNPIATVQALVEALEACAQANRMTGLPETTMEAEQRLDAIRAAGAKMRAALVAGRILLAQMKAQQAAPEDANAEITREWAQRAQAVEQAVCKGCNAYTTLVKSLESQLAHHRANAAKYHEAISTLASERAANAMLTEQVQAQQAALREVRRQLADFNEGAKNHGMVWQRDLISRIDAHLKGEKP
jgi:chromosome segregation ATPase